MRKESLKSLVMTVFKIMVAAGIIYWLSSQGKLNFEALKSLLQPGPFLLGLALIAGTYFFATERWRVLLQTQGLELKTWPLIKLTMIGVFFNFAIPGGVGGDIVKAYYFYRDQKESKSVALSSVLVDRILGLFTMTVMAFVVMIYDIQHILSVPILSRLFFLFSLLLITFILTLYFLFTKNRFIQNWIHKIIAFLPKKEKFLKLYTATQLYGHSTKKLFLVGFYSLIAQVLMIFFLILAGEVSGLSDGVHWSTYFLVAPLGFMATAIPISPAGIGVGQVAFFFLFNNYLGRPSDLGPTTVTALQLMQIIFGFIGVIFYLQRKDKTTSISDVETEQPT